MDHSARIKEIEARLAEAERTGYTRSFDREAPADLRYLLDRVRELEAEPREIEYGVTCGFTAFCDRPRGHDGDHRPSVPTFAITDLRERIEALEAALGDAWLSPDHYECTLCGAVAPDAYSDDGSDIEHRAGCPVVILLPAPETVETQG